ncbi:MAG: 3-hydroxyacyl-CoA dehydrogenase family protein [Terracidiphilus sp.]
MHWAQEDFNEAIADLDDAAPVDSILASSSSGLTMSAIQSACKHPERCLIGHPFNPPHLIPLVEIVAGTKTSPEAVKQVIAFCSSIGKKPIHLRKEVVGHVANRLQAALYREVVNLIEEGVLNVADADTAVCWGYACTKQSSECGRSKAMKCALHSIPAITTTARRGGSACASPGAWLSGTNISWPPTLDCRT